MAELICNLCDLIIHADSDSNALTMLGEHGDVEHKEAYSLPSRPLRVVAILETMWDWRGLTSDAGYERQAPRFFHINPENFSGRRLYKLVGDNAQLLVTNACRELATHAKQHGTPDPAWLAENLAEIESNHPNSVAMDVLLVCGKVAQETFRRCGYKPKSARIIEIPHPAARRVWTRGLLESTAKMIQGETP